MGKKRDALKDRIAELETQLEVYHQQQANGAGRERERRELALLREELQRHKIALDMERTVRQPALRDELAEARAQLASMRTLPSVAPSAPTAGAVGSVLERNRRLRARYMSPLKVEQSTPEPCPTWSVVEVDGPARVADWMCQDVAEMVCEMLNRVL